MFRSEGVIQERVKMLSSNHKFKKIVANFVMSHAILVVEDDNAVNLLLTEKLTKLGNTVTSCSDGEQALILLAEQSYDLIILDVMLPRISGVEVLQQLRTQDISTPTLMLTALGAEQDRIAGFKAGADDYLTKPFSTEELLLRVEAILRRTKSESQFANQKTGENSTTEYLSRLAVALEFTPIELQIMTVFFANIEQTLSKPYLYQEALSKSFRQFDRTLDMHISNIRKKIVTLENCDIKIQTVHGEGYKMFYV